MTPKIYHLLARCVEEGVALGLARAFKHSETPTTDQMVQAIYSAVMNEICEWFNFPVEGEEFTQ